MKIKAFTITEVVVVLLLTVIAFGIISGILSMAKGMYNSESDSLFNLWDKADLYTLLNEDIFTSDKTQWENSSLICCFSTGKTVYHFYDKKVERFNGVATKNRELFNLEILKIEVDTVEYHRNILVKTLRLLTQKDGDTIPLLFYKHY